jgi:aromatic-L-amino-acid/L-tryptophan decarboxylase
MDALRGPAIWDTEETLDPTDWSDVKKLSHRMVDDSIGYLRDVRERPVWQEMPVEVKATFERRLPRVPTPLGDVYRRSPRT